MRRTLTPAGFIPRLNIALMGISRLFLSVFRITCVCDCNGGTGAAERLADGITGDTFTRIISAEGLTTICEAISESICPAASPTTGGVGVARVRLLQTAIDALTLNKSVLK